MFIHYSRQSVAEMAKYRSRLDQLLRRSGDGKHFLTDGGLETVLIFELGIELPEFAAFALLKTDEGRKKLRDYSVEYVATAKKFGLPGFLLDTPTWRASPDWAGKLSISNEELVSLNKLAVADAKKIRDEYDNDDDGKFSVVISGPIGPRGDAYSRDGGMTSAEAKEYHSLQIGALAEAGVDLIFAPTLPETEEAIGMVKCAKEKDVPIAVSFTLETDGKLPSGDSLKAAIEKVELETDNGPVYYGINCSHPSHFSQIFSSGVVEPWMKRIRAVRANASKMSHAELDCAPELDAGDPVEYGKLHADLWSKLPELAVIGGCCGTNAKHMEQVCLALEAERSAIKH